MRHRLAIGILMPWLLCAGSAMADDAAQSTGHRQIVEQVDARVHVFRQADVTFAGVIGNVTVIEQSRGLVLVDSGDSHGTGLRVVDHVRAISDKPVTTVVITHWHNDHPLGLSAIVEAWPDVEIIAHREAVADMEAGRLVGVPRAASAEYEAQRAKTLNEAYDELESGEAAAATTTAEREGWQRALASRADRLANVRGTHLRLPTRTITDTLSVPDEHAPVEVLFLGRANTSGDLSVWLPKQRVLVAGDAVVAPVPYMFNVYPSEMLQVFVRMRELSPAVLIPGHGAPQRNTRYLDRLTALVQDMQRQVGPLASQGLSLEDVTAQTDFSAQQRAFAGDDPWLAYWMQRYALTPLLDSVYREAKGEPLGPPAPAG